MSMYLGVVLRTPLVYYYYYGVQLGTCLYVCIEFRAYQERHGAAAQLHASQRHQISAPCTCGGIARGQRIVAVPSRARRGPVLVSEASGVCKRLA